jgi:hypothetical protein
MKTGMFDTFAIKTCPICNEEFKVTYQQIIGRTLVKSSGVRKKSNRKYCSTECGYEAAKRNARKRYAEQKEVKEWMKNNN